MDIEGNYLFIHHGFGHDLAPQLTLHQDGVQKFSTFEPRGHTFTLTFDTTERFCAGWHDLASSESFPCPDSTRLSAQFDHCRHCQNKTGFNPAFYNATSVSPQQQARNAQPHFLYIAHMAPGVVKVGISWAGRGIRRLLDQGARSCLIIKTYPTATVARQYEAKIAALPGIAETLQAKAKYKLLNQAYNPVAAAQELIAVRERIAKECGITPDNNDPQFLDAHYLHKNILNNPILLHDEQKISGTCLGVIGSLLLVEQDGQQFGLPLGKFTGYRAHIRAEQEANAYAPQQASLF